MSKQKGGSRLTTSRILDTPFSLVSVSFFSVVLVVLIMIGAFYVFTWFKTQFRQADANFPTSYEAVPTQGGLLQNQLPVEVAETYQPLPPLDWSNLSTFTNTRFGLTFDYIADASQVDAVESGDSKSHEIYGFSLVRENLDDLTVYVADNPKQYTAKQWFELKRNDYDPKLLSESNELTLQNGSAYVISQPSTCRSIPMIVVFAAVEDKMYEMVQSGVSRDNKTPRTLQLFLSNLYVNNGTIKLEIPSSLLVYPAAPNIKLDCLTKEQLL